MGEVTLDIIFRIICTVGLVSYFSGAYLFWLFLRVLHKFVSITTLVLWPFVIIHSYLLSKFK